MRHHNLYYCSLVVGTVISAQNERVLSFSGNHMINKTNSDVGGIRIMSRLAHYSPHGFAAFFVNIVEFYISNAQLKQINRNDLRDIKNLNVLYLADNDLTEIPEDLLMDQTELELIALDENQIEKLPENVFYNQRNLKKLFLSKNKLRAISSSLLKNNKQLELIWLHENQIVYLSPKLFESFPQLTEMKIGFNPCISTGELNDIKQANEATKPCNLRCNHEIVNKTNLKRKVSVCNLTRREILDENRRLKNELKVKMC